MSSANDETLQFIADYRQQYALWDVSSKLYTNKNVRNEALAVLGGKYNLDIQGVKNKIKSLRSYFSKEHQKVMKIRISGDDEQYESPWFGYKPLLFILDSANPRETSETEDGATRRHSLIREYTQIVPLEEEIASSITSRTLPHAQDKPSSPPVNNKRTANNINGDKSRDEVYHLMKIAGPQLTETDEAAILGQLVAAKVRKLGPRNQAIAGNQILNVLFNLEMQELGDHSEEPQNPPHSRTPSP